MKSGKHISTLIIVLLLALMLPSLISLLRGPAATPDLFSAGYSLEQANALSDESGKPVYVLATADWCAPCQALKRGALHDPQVVDLIENRAIPVYLESGTNPEEIRSLGVRAFPTTMILEHGQVISMMEGGASAERYADALRSSLPESP